MVRDAYETHTPHLIIGSIVGGGWPALAQTTTPTAPPVAVTSTRPLRRDWPNKPAPAEIDGCVDAAGFVVQQAADRDYPDVAFVGGTPGPITMCSRFDFPLRPSEVIYPDIPDNSPYPPVSAGRFDSSGAASTAQPRARRTGGKERRRRGVESARSDLRLEITRAFWGSSPARNGIRPLDGRSTPSMARCGFAQPLQLRADPPQRRVVRRSAGLTAAAAGDRSRERARHRRSRSAPLDGDRNRGAAGATRKISQLPAPAPPRCLEVLASMRSLPTP